MDKSLLTLFSALLLVAAGLALGDRAGGLMLDAGLFAFSGAVTNWLAIHMLFEKVPGFYGSGVIPARFEEFKSAIRALIMEQFFDPARIAAYFDRLQDDDTGKVRSVGLERLVDGIDLDKAFESLVEVIMQSSFAGLLGMFGGREALEPLKEPFVTRMRTFLLELGEDRELMGRLKTASTGVVLDHVEKLIDERLAELTPAMVKELMQRMIREHLGWLVIWGGVLGGLFGLLASLARG